MDDSKYAILGDKIYFVMRVGIVMSLRIGTKVKISLLNLCYRLAFIDSYRDACTIACCGKAVKITVRQHFQIGTRWTTVNTPYLEIRYFVMRKSVMMSLRIGTKVKISFLNFRCRLAFIDSYRDVCGIACCVFCLPIHLLLTHNPSSTFSVYWNTAK